MTTRILMALLAALVLTAAAGYQSEIEKWRQRRNG